MLNIGLSLAIHIAQNARKVRVFRAAFHAGDAVVAAQRDAGDAVAAAIALKADIGARQADHKLRDAHAKGASSNKVAQLVNHHKNNEDNKPPKDG